MCVCGQAHLLRATIADITADTTLSLAGLIEPDDDAAAEEPPVFKVKAVDADEDDAKTFTLPELRAPEAWLHAEIDIRPNGRCQVPLRSTPPALAGRAHLLVLECSRSPQSDI